MNTKTHDHEIIRRKNGITELFHAHSGAVLTSGDSVQVLLSVAFAGGAKAVRVSDFTKTDSPLGFEEYIVERPTE